MINRFHVMTFTAVLVLATLAQAQTQTFTTLYNFSGGSNGGWPYAGAIQDKAGNLYGTTSSYGGSGYDGVVYKLDTAGNETVLHSFSGSDGASPYTPVIRDNKGNIYGTTAYGGSSSYGVVFKIDTAGNETVLHSFAGGTEDGCYPYQGLVMDKSGNLYGTTNSCGASNYGTVYKLTPNGTETILHNFAGGPKDGAYPAYGHLLMDKAGDLYGVTQQGGAGCAYACGVVYKLAANGTLTLLHSFVGGTSDGCWPFGSAAKDKSGGLYGTTEYCGSLNLGTVWKLTKKGKETILHSFAGYPSDGALPQAAGILDSEGNLYGDTPDGGSASICLPTGCGTVWELSANGTYTLLHSFDLADGASPTGELLRAAAGGLLGTAVLGGSGNCTNGCGTVWLYVP